MPLQYMHHFNSHLPGKSWLASCPLNPRLNVSLEIIPSADFSVERLQCAKLLFISILNCRLYIMLTS